MALIENDLLGNTRDKVADALARLRTFEPPEGYALQFSGGKDSIVIKRLSDMAGVKYDAHYAVTTVDPPELVRFIRKEYPDVIFDRPEKTMRELIIQTQMPPTRMNRYCCKILKERNSEGRIAVTGVRWAESIRRRDNQGTVTIFKAKDAKKAAEENGAQYSSTKRGGIILNDDNDETCRTVEQCYRTNTTLVNPIIDWTDADVWEFIHREKIPYCSLYDEGFRRLGCIGCPMAGAKYMETEFARWPAYKKMYLSAFDQMLKNRAAQGKTTRWRNATEVMEWWLKRSQVLPDGQMRMEVDDAGMDG